MYHRASHWSDARNNGSRTGYRHQASPPTLCPMGQEYRHQILPQTQWSGTLRGRETDSESGFSSWRSLKLVSLLLYTSYDTGWDYFRSWLTMIVLIVLSGVSYTVLCCLSAIDPFSSVFDAFCLVCHSVLEGTTNFMQSQIDSHIQPRLCHTGCTYWPSKKPCWSQDYISWRGQNRLFEKTRGCTSGQHSRFCHRPEWDIRPRGGYQFFGNLRQTNLDVDLLLHQPQHVKQVSLSTSSKDLVLGHISKNMNHLQTFPPTCILHHRHLLSRKNAITNAIALGNWRGVAAPSQFGIILILLCILIKKYILYYQLSLEEVTLRSSTVAADSTATAYSWTAAHLWCLFSMAIYLRQLPHYVIQRVFILTEAISILLKPVC